MLGASIEPIAAHSARATPVTPANIMLVTITTYASPPRKWPTRLLAKAMRLGRMPQRCMTSPAMTKNGMASSGNESIPENISVGSTAIGTTPDSQMKASPPSPRQNATGTPSTMVTAKTATSTRISMGSQIFDRQVAALGFDQAEAPSDDDQRHQHGADGNGEVEPEDRHVQRGRELVPLVRQRLEARPREGQEEEQREGVRDERGDLADRRTEPIADPARRHVGAVPQRDDSTQERDPDHRVPRQLLGEDERGAEPAAEDDLHHDGQEHRADPDEGQRL